MILKEEDVAGNGAGGADADGDAYGNDIDAIVVCHDSSYLHV